MSNDLIPSPSQGAGPSPEHPTGYVDVDPAHGSYEDDFESGQLDWRRYLAAIWRFKWLVAGVALLGTLAGVGLARLIEPEYEAEATIWVEVTDRGDASRGPIRSGELLQSYSWVDLLKTYLVLEEVVRQERLYLYPRSPEAHAALADFRIADHVQVGDYRLTVDAAGQQFVLAARSGEVLERGMVGDSIGPDLGFKWAPSKESLSASSDIEFGVYPPRDMAYGLSQRLSTQMGGNGNFLRVRMRGQQPERLANTLNAVAERYIQVAADLKSAKLEELTRILDEQLSQAAQQLQEAEQALEGYRVRTITLPSEKATPVNPGVAETRDPAFQNFFQLQVEQEQLRRDRESIERALEQSADSGLSVEALEVVPAVQNATELASALSELTGQRAELRALRARYRESAPPVREVRNKVERLERQTVPSLARALLAELRTRETEIKGLIEAASGELREVPTRTIEEQRLERRVAIQENLYTTLQARYEQARLAAASSIPDVSILDRAVAPRHPVNQKKILRLIFMAAVGSLGLGLAVALLLDRIDPRLRYPDQISKELGLPILGTVPRVSERTLVSSAGAAAQVVEAFRVIRLNLLHAYGSAGPVVLTVTSPESQDGKSFVTANLGLAFAELRRRTLVIDADVRRGTQHRLLNCSRRPGLIDALAGSVESERVIRNTNHESLYLIPSGSRRQNGPELLQSNTMAAFLAELRGGFDVIILDSPPLAAGVDPLALGTLTGNMVVVLRTGVTDRSLTTAKLDMLYRLPIRVLGAVMNAVPARGAGYYHPYYSYLPGYEAVDEDAGPAEPGRAVATLGPESAADEGGHQPEDDGVEREDPPENRRPPSGGATGSQMDDVAHPSAVRETTAPPASQSDTPESGAAEPGHSGRSAPDGAAPEDAQTQMTGALETDTESLPTPADPRNQSDVQIATAGTASPKKPRAKSSHRQTAGTKKPEAERRAPEARRLSGKDLSRGRSRKNKVPTVTNVEPRPGDEEGNGQLQMPSSPLSQRTREAMEEVMQQAQSILRALDELGEAGPPDRVQAMPGPAPTPTPRKRPILRATKVPFKPMDEEEQAEAHRAHQRRVQNWKSGRKD